MKRSPLIFAISAVVCLWLQTPGAAGTAPAALKTFLEREGYGGSALHRRFGNHLFVDTVMNGRRTALVVDTGCPFTLLDRNTARKVGLALQETKNLIGDVHGGAQRYAIGRLSTLAMGNCTFVNVPVEVADESELNVYSRPHMDGLFGAHEMAKFGMIIDCTRQMIYVNPKGHSASTSQKLSQFLAGRGFVRIPMHFDQHDHLQIDGTINGRPLQLIVDTGAFGTVVAPSVATAAGATFSALYSSGGEGIGRVNQLALGGRLIVNNAEVSIEKLPSWAGAGLLGEEYLSWNFGIADLGGMNLYLRPPESAPVKKR